MQERIKEIPTRIMEFWKKYSSKQKTIIIAVICGSIFSIQTDMDEVSGI